MRYRPTDIIRSPKDTAARAAKKSTFLYCVWSAIIVSLSSCSAWKDRVVPQQQPGSYAYQGDTLDHWSLARLDSMGGRWGYVSADGKSTIQPIFDWADDFMEGMALVYDKDHYTFLNQRGQQMKRIKASHAYPFSEGLAAVQKGDKWGYINERGRWVIKPQFDWALPFSQNRAAVALHNHYGFINPQGEMLITPQYEDTEPFMNHLSIVRKNGKYGLIDTLGNEIQPAHYKRIEPWKKGTYKLHVNDKYFGLASPRGDTLLDTVYSSITVESNHFLRVVRDRFAGLFDFNGREILPTAYTFLGFISDEGFLAAMKNGRYGIVDTTGKTVLPFIYDDGQPGFTDGRIAVYQDKKLLLMDTAFQLIKELPYDKCYTFSHGFAIVEKRSETDYYGKQFGYIDREGNEVIPPQYHSAYGFNRYGLTIVGIRKDGITRYLVIDTTGTPRPIALAGDHSSDCPQQVRLLYGLKPFGNRIFYNDSGGESLKFLSSKTGHIIQDIPYTAFAPLRYSDRSDLAKVRIDASVGLIDTTLTERLPVQFEDISTYAKNRIAVKQKGKWGFADERFRFRIPFAYDKVSSFRYRFAEVEHNKQKGLIDCKGRTIVPLQYKNTTVDSTGNRIYAEREKGSDIYNMYGRLLLRSDYDYISGYWGKNYSTFRLGDQMGVMDYDFRILCEPQYDRIGPLYEGRAWVVNNGKGGFLDSTFQVVIPVEYDYIEDYALGFTQVKKDDETYYIDIDGKKIRPTAEEIADRKDTLEKRTAGFIDFSS